MNLLLVGVSHHTAPVDLREKLDFSSGDVGAAAQELAARTSVPECVVLSTCNRSEIYVGNAEGDRTGHDVVDFLSEFHHLPRELFTPHLFSLTGREAVTHLFRVAAGLDSAVVGEPQILGQVKDAFQRAAERRCTGPLLDRLFKSSFRVGKRVRSETALGEGAVSVSFEAVAIARKIFERLDGRRVLVVGAGDISTLTAQHLRTNGVGEILITSRTTAHAQELAEKVSGRPLPWRDLEPALATADIVITATGAARPVITRTQVEPVTRRRTDPLYIIDLAVPRDVEPAVGDIEQVFLYNIDDLQKFVQKNVSLRTSEIDRAEAIVSEEVAQFLAWQRSRSAVPTIVALRKHFYGVRDSELLRLEGKLAGLSPDARERFEEVTRLILEKLLLEPTERLKALPDQETQVAYTEVLNRLFRLSADPDADVGQDTGAAIKTRRQ
jgi:glutamyl-tRNA reductase